MMMIDVEMSVVFLEFVVMKNLNVVLLVCFVEVLENFGFGVVFMDYMVDICWLVKGGWYCLCV